MAQATPEVSAPPVEDLDAPLYRHTKRPEWGVAVLVRETDDRRVYQFEDGRLRQIRKGYYKLIEVVSDLGDRADHIRTNLTRVVRAQRDDTEQKVVEAVAPFSAQVALFTKLYPGGFEAPEWIGEHRRTDGAALKRHRTPISAEAREALGPTRFDEALAADGHGDFLEMIADILSRTDLVPVAHAKALRGLEPDEKRTYVESVGDLLHGPRGYEQRFKDHLDTLQDLFGEGPSWRVATTLPGLVHPQAQVVVRRSAFIRQAGSVAPTAHYTRRARLGSYRSFRRVAFRVRDRLKAAGHEPRDLLDVHDFIWTTLRTSALEHLGGDA